MKPVANSQNRKLCVSLMVLRHQYVLLLALVHAQNGPTKEGRSSFRKQELFIERVHNIVLSYLLLKITPGVEN